jgi:hypothetical protein
LKVELVAIERADGLLVERLLDAGLRVPPGHNAAHAPLVPPALNTGHRSVANAIARRDATRRDATGG